jgi:glutathione synthase/RimK-type ligase-like ATP-grasp enzyme
MIVGVCVRFDCDSLNAPFKDSDTLPLLQALQSRMPHIRLLGLDWRTVTPQGVVLVYDLRHGAIKIHLSDIRVVHVLHLGYGTSKKLSLRDKWREVREKIEIMSKYGVNIINPAISISYGINKMYLSDLARMGLPVIETLRLPSSLSLDVLREKCDSRFQIIKPANGECGKLVLHIDTLTSKILDRYRQECDEVLLQPFAHEISLGEKSLIFLGSRFLHAVRKIPSSSDFRANGFHTGASVYPYEPMDAELALGNTVKEMFPYPIHVFRLDLIGEGIDLRIMEVEVVDPNHYCMITDSYLDALARFYIERAFEVYS